MSFRLTWEEARKAITNHFITEWGGQLDYFLEGQEQPDLTQRTTPFVLFAITAVRTTQIGMLGKTPPKRAYGQVDVTVFVPMSVGARVRMEATDKLDEMFAAVTAGAITFQDTRTLSLVDGKDWRSQTVLADFYFEKKT
jgi:hypothetical protein